MLTIPNSIKTLFKTDGTRKNFRVQFPNGELPDITNDNIVRESVHFTESICSQSTFRFGLAEASVVEFETVGIPNMYGYTISCSYEIDTSSLSASDISAIQSDPGDGELVLASASDIGFGFYRIPLGVFRVERCPRNHGAMTHRQVTAYGLANFPNFSIEGKIPVSSFTLTLNDILSIAIPSYRIDGEYTVQNDYRLGGSRICLFDVNKVRYSVDAAENSAQIGDPMPANISVTGTRTAIRRYYLSSFSNAPHFYVSNSDNDAEHYQAGENAAEALTSAGYDLTYDSNGTKIYASNKDALMAVMPELFYNVYPYFDTDYKRTGYMIARYGVPMIYNGSVLFLSGVTNPKLVLSQGDTGTITDALVFSGVTKAYASASVYRTSPSSESVEIASTGQTGVGYAAPTSTSSDKTTSTYPVFSFSDAIDFRKSLGDALECKGEFAKDDRLGGVEEFALSPSSPLAISPGDYDECWWDEYDVSQIGTVTVTYRNGEEGEATANATLGAGASLYDMTDNEVLKNLSTADLDSITTLLSGDFATNAQNVGFTPIEMTMQGWPWLEAGDALQITAEDGTVVNTYALRVEMSGIQHLMSDITAEGGEIIGEV